MKRLLVLSFSLMSLTTCLGQTGNSNGEFAKSASGLIYSDTTMKQLHHIVDSLNLKFRVCETRKTYYSKLQAKAHFISLSSGNIKAAKKDMENNMPFDDFVKKYPTAETEKNLLVVKFMYKNYNDNDVVEFSSIPLSEKYEHEIQVEGKQSEYDKKRQGTWVFDHYEKDKYSGEWINGFYFATEFTSIPLPVIYAGMVQYSDCMVDTNAQIFKEHAERTGVRYSNDKPSKVAAFLNYVHEKIKKAPEPDEDDGDDKYEAFWKEYQTWDSLRIVFIDTFLSKQEKFKTLIKEATEEALANGGSDNELEEYVGRYYSLKNELELKRGRIVVGGCSMDGAPRAHAMNIAVLAAETVNWEIFLRAHLDIMNDHFERASDGSYAWGRRQTYIKELEDLEINVIDLLLGITLRVENPSQNHYYGSISRLGRALAETKYTDEIKTKMLAMIKDNSLDDYNRILAYYLFLNYNNWIEKDTDKKSNLEKLKEATKELPEYLASRIKFEKKK